uniref:Metalloprotease TIKI homolog n=1 Tax=Globodera pallida TaxID=36090 RepID=A0A183BRQ8_GLOPA
MPSSSRIVVPRRMPCRRICPQFVALFLTLSALRAAHPPHVENVRKAKSTFLWSIDSPARSVRSFLFGTIHVPYDKVWQYVSARVKEAFGAAEAIVFELELQNSDTVLRLAKCKQLERDGNLRHLLPPDVFARIRAFMHRLRQRMFRWSLRANGNDRQKARQNVRRLFPNDWARRKPTWLLFLLLQMGGDDEQHQHWSEQFSEQQQRVPMLDLYLAQMALGQGKQLLSVESVEEQCDPLESVQTGQLVFAINYTLAYLEWAEGRQADGGREKEQNGLEMSHHEEKQQKSGVNASSQTPSALERLVQLYNCGTMGDGMEEVNDPHRTAQKGTRAQTFSKDLNGLNSRP